jgi:hypothetical protein
MKLADAAAARDTYATAQKSLSIVLGQVRAGDFSGIKGLDSALSTLTGANTDMYANSTDYRRDYWKTYLAISEMEKLTGTQVDYQQSMVDKQQSTIDLLTKTHNDTLAAMDAQLSALEGINTSVLSVGDAIAAYTAAQNNVDKLQNSITTDTTADTITAAKAFYSIGTATIKAIIPGAGDFLHNLGIPGFAAGGDFPGGIGIFGENGPEIGEFPAGHIYNNKDSKRLFDTSAITDAIEQLREDVKTIGFVLAKNTGKVADITDKWDGIGIPPTDTRT